MVLYVATMYRMSTIYILFIKANLLKQYIYIYTNLDVYVFVIMVLNACLFYIYLCKVNMY